MRAILCDAATISPNDGYICQKCKKVNAVKIGKKSKKLKKKITVNHLNY